MIVWLCNITGIGSSLYLQVHEHYIILFSTYLVFLLLIYFKRQFGIFYLNYLNCQTVKKHFHHAGVLSTTEIVLKVKTFFPLWRVLNYFILHLLYSGPSVNTSLARWFHKLTKVCNSFIYETRWLSLLKTLFINCILTLVYISMNCRPIYEHHSKSDTSSNSISASF